MDILAEHLLWGRSPARPAQGPAEYYLPLEPSNPWDPQRHAAWATFAYGSELDIHILRYEPLMHANLSEEMPPRTAPLWITLAAEVAPMLSRLPRRASAACAAPTLFEASAQ